MIKIDNVEVVGWEAAIRGMRNPMNSWDESDSFYGCRLRKGDNVNWKNHKIGDVTRCHGCGWCEPLCFNESVPSKRAEYIIGDNDLDLMKKLVKAGADHRKFMRMITVYLDVTAPLYWWKEADTYNVGTVRNSCSTMHKITDKEFTLDDFSCEHLCDNSIKVLEKVLETLNLERENFLSSKDKWCWQQIIQLLPSSYNQRATLQLNYAVLRNMYHSRKEHKLDEWRDFCKWIETLPYSELIVALEGKSGGYAVDGLDIVEGHDNDP